MSESIMLMKFRCRVMLPTFISETSKDDENTVVNTAVESTYDTLVNDALDPDDKYTNIPFPDVVNSRAVNEFRVRFDSVTENIEFSVDI